MARPLEVLLVAGVAMAISAFATLVPSHAAAARHPVDGLRHN
jgi:ABC-type lipoprotein release transport system permease subunit